MLSPAYGSVKDEYVYLSTLDQTTFSGVDINGNTLAYQVTFIDVFVEGIKLVPGDDFTATDGIAVVTTSPLPAGRDVQIVSTGVFSSADHYSKTILDNGQLDTRYYTKDEAMPIGAVIAIMSDLTGSHSIPASGVVDATGWMYCDGSTVPAGKRLEGVLPDLTDGRFLRGSTVAGATSGSDTFTLGITNIPAHTHSTPNHTHPNSTTSSAGSHIHTIRVRYENAGGHGTLIEGADATYPNDHNAVAGSMLSAGAHTHTTYTPSGGGGTSGSAGSGTAVTHIPKYVNAQYLIKVA